MFTVPILAFTMTDPGVHVAPISAFTSSDPAFNLGRNAHYPPPRSSYRVMGQPPHLVDESGETSRLISTAPLCDRLVLADWCHELALNVTRA